MKNWRVKVLSAKSIMAMWIKPVLKNPMPPKVKAPKDRVTTSNKNAVDVLKCGSTMSCKMVAKITGASIHGTRNTLNRLVDAGIAMWEPRKLNGASRPVKFYKLVEVSK